MDNKEKYINHTSGGLLQCAADQMVSGFTSKYGTKNHFIFEPVPSDMIKNANEIISLSQQISMIQSEYTNKNQKTMKER